MSTKKTNKELTLDFLAKDSGKYDKPQKVTLENGMFVKVYRNLSNRKIDFILHETMDFLSESLDNGSLDSLHNSEFLGYVNFHLILHGTSLGEDKKFSYEEKVQLFERIALHDYFEAILKEFNQEDKDKVLTRFTNMLNNMTEMIKNNPKLVDNLKSITNENETSNENGDQEDGNI